MSEPKFKIGQEVRFNGIRLSVKSIREYGDTFVYDFFPSKGTLLPLNFTGIAEREITPLASWRAIVTWPVRMIFQAFVWLLYLLGAKFGQ